MSRLIDLDHLAGLGADAHTRLHMACLLSAHPGLTVTSVYRSPARNREVGGAPNSWHTKHRAADFTGPIDLLRRAAKTAKAQRVSAGCTGPLEVLLEDVGTRNQHLHVAW